MRIALLSNMYHPEQYASAPLNTQAAEYLAGRGHDVTVVTSFPHYPEWSVWPEWRGRFWSDQVSNSVRVRRIRSYVPREPRTVGRVAHYASFAAASMAGLVGLPRPDVIVCVCPPIELAYTGALWARLRGSKLVLWVKDLVPEIAIQLGMLQNRAAIALARQVERRAYGLADRVLVICNGFREYLQRFDSLNVPVEVLPDWVDANLFTLSENTKTLRDRFGIPPDAFVVAHSGNMGRKQGLDTVIGMASELRPEDNVVVLLVGGGSERDRLVRLADAQHASAVRFMPMLPSQDYPKLLACADVLLLHQRAQATDSVIPSKLLTYMASGKPVLAAVNPSSETARTLCRTGAGLVITPEDSAAMRDAVIRLRESNEERLRLGHAGRQAVLRSFSRDVVLNNLEGILSETIDVRATRI